MAVNMGIFDPLDAQVAGPMSLRAEKKVAGSINPLNKDICLMVVTFDHWCGSFSYGRF
ncbi:MAG: hypothetical protein H2042_11070 [Rhizobiales bacterium]|nr:hypothetical protein [Hyphomicrobiales bacterium]